MKTYSARNQNKRSANGQAMVEFALSVMFLLLILFSVLYFGRYFLISQVLLYAAEEGARIASRTPDLSDDTTRDMVRGFTTGGAMSNQNSVIYAVLSSAGLLSQKNSGNLPAGSSVQILPWDGTANNVAIPAGTIGVAITYPFNLLGGPVAGNAGPVQNLNLAMSFNGHPIQFLNFNITQQAVAAQEVYQQ